MEWHFTVISSLEDVNCMFSAAVFNEHAWLSQWTCLHCVLPAMSLWSLKTILQCVCVGVVQKFREYTISCNRLARLQTKYNSIQKALGDNQVSTTGPTRWERERDTGICCPSCVPHCWFTAICMAQLVCYRLPATVGLVPSFSHRQLPSLFLPLWICSFPFAAAGLIPYFCHCWLVTPSSATVDLLSLFCYRWFVTPFLPLLICYPFSAIAGLLPPLLPLLICYHVSAIVGLLPPFCHCWFVIPFLPLLVCYPLSAIADLLPILPLLVCFHVAAIVGLLPHFCHCWLLFCHCLLPPFSHCWFVTPFLLLLTCYPFCRCWFVTHVLPSLTCYPFLPLLICYPLSAMVGF